MTVEKATEVFVKAMSLIRSRTYPHPAERFEGLWILQDNPPRKRQRKSEVVVVGLSPSDAVASIKRFGLGWHFVCAIHPVSEFEQCRAAYKSLGYRALGSEGFFVHDLQELPSFVSAPPSGLVSSGDVAFSSQLKVLLPGCWIHGVKDKGVDVGTVKSVPVDEDAWVSDLYVRREFRAKGYGKALMSDLLRTCKERGVRNSVLLASSDGERIYPTLGYKKIATLQIFSPLR